MSWDDVDRLLANTRRLIDSDRIDLLTIAGNRMVVAAEAVIPPYPQASGKALPAVYQRTTAPKFTYRKVGGRWQKTNKVAKGGEPRPYLSKFKTAKQQRYFFAAISKGQIKVPYRRSGDLGRSIVGRIVEVTPQGVAVGIGSGRPEAPLVIGRGRQSAYHKGTWWILEDAIDKRAPEVISAGAEAMVGEMRKRMAR